MKDDWISNFESVLEREPFPLDRQAFAFRPVEVLGLSLGASQLLEPNSESRSKLNDIVARCVKEGNMDAWSTAIYTLSQSRLIDDSDDIDLVVPAVDDWDFEYAALLKWLSTGDSGLAIDPATITKAENKLLTECLLGNFRFENISKVALLSDALAVSAHERIESRLAETELSPSNAQRAIEIAVHLCERFPLFARQLRTRRKDVKVDGQKDRIARPTIDMVDDDVQDSLHAVLKLFFDDVRPEEWTPSYAGNQNRVDFILPAEKIVIEVKFFGARLTRRKIVEQLIIDKEYYRHIEHCETLICIIYDPETRCDNPVALMTDVSSEEDELRVVTIVYPTGL